MNRKPNKKQKNKIFYKVKIFSYNIGNMPKADTKARLYGRALKYKKKECQKIRRTKKSMKEYLGKHGINTKGMKVVEMKRETKQEYNKRCPAISKMNKAQLKRFTEQYAPVKRVRFAEDMVKIFEQKERMSERREILRGIGQRKAENRKIAKILYKKIPTQEEYIKVRHYNKKATSKQILKKDPLRVVKIRDTPLKIMPSFRIKYIIKRDLVKGKILAKVGGKQKTFKYNQNIKFDKYRAEYDAKLFIINQYRKIFKKKKIA